MLGLRVIPLTPNGKRPIGSMVPHGVKQASSDPDMIDAWWEREPDANIGLALGDLLVIDNDQPKNGGDLSATEGIVAPQVITQSGGSHHYFSRPENFSRKKSKDNIDVLTGNSYVLMPPSVVNGKPYRWASGDSRLLVGLTVPPAGLLERLLGTSEFGSRPSLASLDEGGRNDTIYSLGARLLAFGYPEYITSKMLQYSSASIDSPLSDTEVARVVKSLTRYNTRTKISMWTSPVDRLDESELSHKVAKLSGVLRGLDASRSVLNACIYALITSINVTFEVSALWIMERVENAMTYAPNYSHFLRRNGANDSMWAVGS